MKSTIDKNTDQISFIFLGGKARKVSILAGKCVLSIQASRELIIAVKY